MAPSEGFEPPTPSLGRRVFMVFWAFSKFPKSSRNHLTISFWMMYNCFCVHIVHLTHFLEGGFPHNDFHTTNLGGKRFCGLRDSRLRPRNLKPKKRNTLSASLICISSEFHFLRSLSMECFLALINCSSRVLFAEYGSGLLCHGEVIQRRPLRDRHRKHRQDKESSGYCP
jgi:hypothetical protein